MIVTQKSFLVKIYPNRLLHKNANPNLNIQTKEAPRVSGALWFFLFGGEFFLAHRAEGALEILGQILKLGAGGDAALGVAQLLIIFPAADVADILHNVFLLFFEFDLGFPCVV